jgi:PAS domain S-box-containing protein
VTKERDVDRDEQLILLQTLLESIPGPVFYKDAGFAYLGCNRAFCDYLGLPRERIVGHTAEDFCSPELAAVYRAADQKLFDNPGTQVYEAQVTYADGSLHDVVFHKSTYLNVDGHVAGLIGVVLDISKRTKAEAQVRRQKQILQQTLDSLKEGILRVALHSGAILDSNAAARELLGYDAEALRGLTLPDLHPDELSNCIVDGWRRIVLTLPETVDSFEVPVRLQDGTTIPCENTLIPLRDENGGVNEGLYVVRDVSRQKREEMERIQTQKLSSIGQLAAGIAHEINTPAQYVGDNLRFLAGALRDLDFVLDLPRLVEQGGDLAEFQAELVTRTAQVDLDFLTEEIPAALSQAQEGIRRIAGIVGAMKEFAHPGGRERELSNLNQIISNAVLISQNEWKHVADLSLDLDPALPSVACLADEIGQVVLNLIVNAAQAITQKHRDRADSWRGTITVATRRAGEHAEIRVADTGGGIPEGIRSRVYDPFFTTKDVGAGSGQGLAIAHDIVCGKHEGRLHFETETGVGTTFLVQLPFRPAGSAAPAPAGAER